MAADALAWLVRSRRAVSRHFNRRRVHRRNAMFFEKPQPCQRKCAGDADAKQSGRGRKGTAVAAADRKAQPNWVKLADRRARSCNALGAVVAKNTAGLFAVCWKRWITQNHPAKARDVDVPLRSGISTITQAWPRLMDVPTLPDAEARWRV